MNLIVKLLRLTTLAIIEHQSFVGFMNMKKNRKKNIVSNSGVTILKYGKIMFLVSQLP